jgi:uncharacterized integral membrane protein
LVSGVQGVLNRLYVSQLKEKKMGSYIKAALLVIVLVVLVTFGIKNNGLIRLHYYFDTHSMEIPIYALVYVSIIIGIFVGMLVGINSRFNQRRRIKTLEKENRELKSKVHAELPEEKTEETPTEETSLEETQLIESPETETDKVKTESGN